MKALLIALALVSTAALAEDYAVSRNTAGGKIVLTTERCQIGTNTYGRAYSTATTGDTLDGCWDYQEDADHVMVVWHAMNGLALDRSAWEVRRYPIENFEIKKRKAQP